MDKFLIFDWYAASINADVKGIIAYWKLAFPLDTLEPAKPRNGYSHSDVFVNPQGQTTLSLLYGGKSQGSKVFCVASGDKSERFANWVRSAYPNHELVRADIAIDFNMPEAWVTLYALGYSYATIHKLVEHYQGQSQSALVDSPEAAGRTLYLGSRSSVAMIRIYEKGKKDNPSLPDWVRVELEFKPKKEEARLAYAKASKLEIISGVKWVKAFFSSLGTSEATRPCSPGTVRALTDHEKTINHLRTQYKNTLSTQLELLGGSYELLGLFLVSEVA